MLSGLGMLWLAGGLVAAAEDKPPVESAAADFKVVVHADNPTAELQADTLAKMFRKKDKRWGHGVSIVPVDLETDSSVREAFTRTVHKKSVTAIKSYWQRMIFSARGLPPKELASDAEVLSFVRENPGGIGYVSTDTPLTGGTKELKVAN